MLFDWDNTLADNWRAITSALTATQHAMGHVPWSEDEARARIRQSLRDSFPTMFGTRWEEAREIFYAHFDRHHLNTLTPLPGAEKLLRAAQGRGIVLGVVSNKTGRYLRREAAALGWEKLFTAAVVGATDAEHDKPDPAPIHLALQGTGIAAGPEVWFIGDADIDLACAHAAGCVPVLLETMPGEGQGAWQPRHRFASCYALYDLVCSAEETM